MAGQREILKEYLVSIGYQTDAISLHKFEDGLGRVGKFALNTGTKVAGAVMAVEAATAAFAYSMRKVYFSAELSNVSVKNLKAIQFAGEQVGISSDAMASSLHAAAIAMRNPGIVAYANALTGIDEAGRDTTEVLNDLVKSTRNMSEVVGAQVMAQFGMDTETYHMWREHGDEMMAKAETYRKAMEEMGVDQGAYKDTVKKYGELLDGLTGKFEGLTAIVLGKALPAFTAWIEGLNMGLDLLAKLALGGSANSQKLDSGVSVFSGMTPEEAANTKRTGRKNKVDLSTLWNTESGMGRNLSDYVTVPSSSTTNGDSLHLHRNERNFNPGNIKYGRFAKAHGAIGADSGSFAIFPSLESGMAAQKGLLSSYGDSGINTVSGIVNHWAPASDKNNTPAYIASVSRKTGFGAGQPLNLNDPKTLSLISYAMAAQEGMSGAGLERMHQIDTTRLDSRSHVTTIHAPVEINITGTGAEQTAKSVSRLVGNSIGAAVRDVQGR